jgi:peptidoglycan-associated lipoprotein
MKTTLSFWMILAAAALMSSACAGTHATSKKDAAPTAKSAGPAAPGALANPALTEAGRTADMEPDVRDANLRSVAELKAAHFPYDSDRLDDSELAILRANADWLKAHADLKVQVAGNCDQRGTVAYNLALGQRRATAVRSYYLSLGVPKDRVATISYGKERLLCAEMVEDCWSRNRRAETLEVVESKVAAP